MKKVINCYFAQSRGDFILVVERSKTNNVPFIRITKMNKISGVLCCIYSVVLNNDLTLHLKMFITRTNQYVYDTLEFILLIFNVIPVQFVVPGRIEADSSPTHVSQFPSGPYPYSPNRTVDGNFSQNIRACLHTAASNVTEAWLRIDLQTAQSIKFVKFWYRNDSMYIF